MMKSKGHQRANLVIGYTRPYMVCHSTLKTLKKMSRSIGPIPCAVSVKVIILFNPMCAFCKELIQISSFSV